MDTLNLRERGAVGERGRGKAKTKRVKEGLKGSGRGKMRMSRKMSNKRERENSGCGGDEGRHLGKRVNHREIIK